jgi:hypothetical protein
MMRAIRLVGWELRAQWRGVLPSAAARAAIVVFCLTWVTFFSYAVVVGLRGSTRSRADALVPLMALFAGTALAVSMAAIARTLERPERFAVWRLAPVPPSWAVAIPLAATALLTSGATLTFAMPAIIAAASGHVLQALLVAALAVITALWIVVFAIVMLAGVASRRGVAAAARLGRSSTAPIAALMIVALRFAAGNARQVDPVMLAGGWLASAALLPAAMRAASAQWLAALAMGPARRRSPAPRWGSASWGRMLWRTPFAWATLGVVPLVISASTSRLVVAAIFALMLPSAAMFHLTQWEDECADRQRLAPAGRRVRLGLWLHVGLPACLLASIAGIVILQDVTRAAVFVAAAWAGPLLFLWSRRGPRAAVQVVVLVVALIVLMAPRSAGAQVSRPGDVTPAASTAAVRGRVLAAHTGAPLSRARVRLTATVDRQTVTVAADAQGAFEFRDLKPGRYLLSAAKGGYVQMQFGQRRAYVAGSPIELKAGDALDRLDIHLPPGASIDGRVLDEFGEPVVDAVVMTLRSQFNGGRKRLAPAGRVLTTNDRGEFHLFGLPPGTYYLSASSMTNQNAGDAAGREGYAPTYFPGTVDLGAAQPIVLDEGEQRLTADVVLHLVRTAAVSGMARDSTGQPFGSGSVNVVNLVSGFPIPVASGTVLADGSFRIANVPPGSFAFIASSAPAADGSRQTAVHRMAVSGEDVAGLMLSAPQPAAIAGTIERDGLDTDPLPPSVQLRIAAADPVEDTGDSGALIRANADRSFAGSFRAGHVRVEVANAPGWHLSRVVHDDRDVTDSGIRADPAATISDVRVVLTRRASTITGNVEDAARQPSRDYTVVVFSRNRLLWTFRSRHVAAARPDQQGGFAIRGLPAGEYLIAAIDHVEQGEGHDAEFLEGIRDRAQSLSIGAGETRRVTLPLTRRR